MSDEKISVRDKIIFAVIECIEREGIQSVTTRSIVKEADVNIASINYYFRSKDNLIKTTLQSRLDHVVKDFEVMANEPGKDPKELISSLFHYLIDGMIRYPNFTKAYFNSAYQNNIYEDYFVSFIEVITNSVYKLYSKYQKKISHAEMKMRVTQMMSALIFQGLLPGAFEKFHGRDAKSREFVDIYIDSLIERFIN